MHVTNARPSIIGNIITENYCDVYIDGGGILCNASDPLIKDNIISSNLGAYRGGGVALLNWANPIITGNIIESNTTQSGWGFAYGAGIYVGETCNPQIYDNLIQSNTIDVGTGGGLYLQGPGSQLVSRNLIIDNTGAGIASVDTNTCLLINNTIVGNTEAIHTENYAHPILLNSIVWDNAIVIGSDMGPSDITVAYNDIQGGWSGTQILDTDPQFGNEYGLIETSPCIDAGTAVYVLGGDTLLYLTPDDYHGNAPDMGAYESVYTSQNQPTLLVPEKLTLLHNFPNPFNPVTTIRYGLPEISDVTLVIYDLTGRVVRRYSENAQPAGWVNLVWDGTNTSGEPVSAGVYLCRLEAGNFTKTIKMVYLK